LATAKEEFERLKILINSGRGNEVVHVVRVDEERKRRLANKPKPTGKQQTRFVLDCGSPEAFVDVYKEWDRILLEVRNRTMAVDFVIRGLRMVDKRQIDEWRNEGEVPHKEPDF
jgi:hypothetical protein